MPVRELVQLLEWTDPRPLHNYYLIVFASKLPGWVWSKQDGRAGYPAKAVAHIHRTLVATRGIADHDQIVAHITQLWRLRPIAQQG